MSRIQDLTDRMISRIHEPLSQRPGPVLSSVITAFAAGLGAVDLRAAQRAMYLDSARGEWLSEWADLYGYTRDGDTDSELLTRMHEQTLLERRKTTSAGILEAIFRATGVHARLRLGDTRVYRFDQVERLAESQGAFDYTSIDEQGREVGHELPEAHAGSRTVQPMGPGWGPGGIWLIMPVPWSAETERALADVLARNLKAGGSVQVGWAVTVRKDVTDQVAMQDALDTQPLGWGIDEWGGSTWG